LVGASDGTNLQPLLVESAANHNLRTALYNGTNEAAIDASGNVSTKVTTALPAGANVIGAVTQSGSWTTQQTVGTTGGSTPYHNLSAASTNATNVKAAATQLYGYAISNTNAAARYVKFYDKATAPTVGTDVPKHTIQVPGNAVVIRALPEGMKFTTGFGWATTTGVADTDTGAVGANDLVIDFDLGN
jgi:hypothetical protein